MSINKNDNVSQNFSIFFFFSEIIKTNSYQINLIVDFKIFNSIQPSNPTF